MNRVIFFSVLWLLALTGQTKVVDQSTTGFVSEHELLLSAKPGDVYQALTADVDRWWDATHSYSGSAGNFTLDARAGGCFCERLEGGGSVQHMEVIFADPGKRLRLRGGLGPLQELAVVGAMDFLLFPHPTGTLLRYRYRVSGSAGEGLQSWAEPVDQVQLGQLLRLQRYLATGAPD